MRIHDVTCQGEVGGNLATNIERRPTRSGSQTHTELLRQEPLRHLLPVELGNQGDDLGRRPFGRVGGARDRPATKQGVIKA